MKRPGRVAEQVLIVACLVYLIAPVVVVVVFAFQGARRTGLPFEGPSLRWFDLIVNDDQFRSALLATLRVAAGAALASTAIALLATLATSRGLIRRVGLIRGAGMAPIVVPPVFIGFTLLLTFGEIGWTPSLLTVFLAHVLVTTPLAWTVLQARFSRFDFSVEEAARDLGASVFKTFLRVTLPMTWRAIAGAALVAFAFSVDEFVVTLFVVGDQNTLPVLVWSRLRRSIDPSINAVATLLLLVIFVSAALAWLVLRPRGQGKSQLTLAVPDASQTVRTSKELSRA